MEFTDELNLQPVRRPVPEPQAGEILIQVSAVGVTPTEKLWYTTSHCADGTARSKAIPGHEFSGTVAGLGAGATGYSLGDAAGEFSGQERFAQIRPCIALALVVLAVCEPRYGLNKGETPCGIGLVIATPLAHRMHAGNSGGVSELVGWPAYPARLVAPMVGRF